MLNTGVYEFDQSTAETIYHGGEGHFHGTVLRDRTTGVIVVHAEGFLDEPTWDDESNPVPSWVRTLNFIEDLSPKRVVWDFSKLRSMWSLGLTYLERTIHVLHHQGARQLMVSNQRLEPTIVKNHLLLICDQDDSVTGAILTLHFGDKRAA